MKRRGAKVVVVYFHGGIWDVCLAISIFVLCLLVASSQQLSKRQLLLHFLAETTSAGDARSSCLQVVLSTSMPVPKISGRSAQGASETVYRSSASSPSTSRVVHGDRIAGSTFTWSAPNLVAGCTGNPDRGPEGHVAQYCSQPCPRKCLTHCCRTAVKTLLGGKEKGLRSWRGYSVPHAYQFSLCRRLHLGLLPFLISSLLI
jgi:hypothetical protein